VKKVIERLEKVREYLIIGSYVPAIDHIEEALAELKNTHCWYTPEQWEAKKREKLRDHALVWIRWTSNIYDSSPWFSLDWERARSLRSHGQMIDIIVANSPYPPPDGWRAEEA
jgi:hypothetical protein